ncbi:DNA polymerase III subunit delta [Microcoleus sp. FACHB-1515]|uniref:DNA polymerase III subunit delta n=1 Tax=Cyanophyceae TaxID=3028117 RepID=UPI0016825F18|nr:DNA polymerase III subunit delta [Microcoleus sp. FACHB-1515]MBD2093327.1 DNA polymerase III subunit delta [Microcoleus sp. FACHB-1515]
MSILILVGDDTQAIEQAIEQAQHKLDPAWRSLNFHRFPDGNLAAAIATVRTLPLCDTRKVVVIDCVLRQWNEEEFALLDQLPRIALNHTLIVVTPAFDKRLKVAKALLRYGTLQEFWLTPPWRLDLIEQAIARQARSKRLKLSAAMLAYLATAIGNDTVRAATELDKLKLYTQRSTLTLSVVKSLVPILTHTSLQLAAAVRDHQTIRAIELLEALRQRGDSPQVICATLITQFRLWLSVKAAIAHRTCDRDIANFCNLTNPNRLYYLKQEIQAISLRSLTQTLHQLVMLDVALRQGQVDRLETAIVRLSGRAA